MDATKRMTCAEAVRQFFAYLDRALTGEALEAFEAHVDACLDCCDRLQFSRQLEAFVKQRLGDAALPEGVEAKVRRAIESAEKRAPGPDDRQENGGTARGVLP